MEDTHNTQEAARGVETPRMRVEAAFAKREELNTAQNKLDNDWADGRITIDALEEKETLLRQEREAWEVSFDEVVSKEPEAQAWFQIAAERKKQVHESYGGQSTHGTTSTDRSWATVIMAGADHELTVASKHLALLQGKTQAPASGPVIAPK